jgi:hypothetical protein
MSVYKCEWDQPPKITIPVLFRDQGDTLSIYSEDVFVNQEKLARHFYFEDCRSAINFINEKLD